MQEKKLIQIRVSNLAWLGMLQMVFINRDADHLNSSSPVWFINLGFLLVLFKCCNTRDHELQPITCVSSPPPTYQLTAALIFNTQLSLPLLPLSSPLLPPTSPSLHKLVCRTYESIVCKVYKFE